MSQSNFVQGPSEISPFIRVSWAQDSESLPKDWNETVSSPLLSLLGGGLSKYRRNRETALLADLCRHCTEAFRLPPSPLLTSRSFCEAAGPVWPGTARWADTVICPHVLCLVLESRLCSFRAQAGSTSSITTIT